MGNGLGILKLIIFSFAISFDGFLVGMNYSTRKIRLSPCSLLVVGTISGSILALALIGVSSLEALIVWRFTRLIGGGILVCLGFRSLSSAMCAKINDTRDKLFCVRLKPLGLIIQIMKEPSSADIDSSGLISPAEAVALGIALSVDAFSAGLAFCAGETRNLWLLPVFGGAFQPLLVLLGMAFGSNSLHQPLFKRGSVVVSLILVLVGILKMSGVA